MKKSSNFTRFAEVMVDSIPPPWVIHQINAHDPAQDIEIILRHPTTGVVDSALYFDRQEQTVRGPCYWSEAQI